MTETATSARSGNETMHYIPLTTSTKLKFDPDVQLRAQGARLITQFPLPSSCSVSCRPVWQWPSSSGRLQVRTATRLTNTLLPLIHKQMEGPAALTSGLLVVYLIIAYHLWKLVRLSRANADLNLLSKRRMRPNAFADKTIWLIGASQGLGHELAVQLAQHGAKLVLSARSESRLKEVARLCTHLKNPQPSVVPLDVTWPQHKIQEVAQQVFSASRIDFIVYATGTSQRARVEAADPATAQQIMEINTLGAIRLASAALPHMLQLGHGRIVIISSMAAVVPAPGQSSYSAAKAGLNAYFESLATELSSRGVGVTICCPGPIAGQPGVDRTVYGPKGLVTASWPRSSSHMQQQAVAELILRATYHKISLCWIAKHPVLLIAYINQYWPTLGRLIMQRIGPGRVDSMEGKTGSGYDWTGFLKRAVRASKTC